MCHMCHIFSAVHSGIAKSSCLLEIRVKLSISVSTSPPWIIQPQSGATLSWLHLHTNYIGNDRNPCQAGSQPSSRAILRVILGLHENAPNGWEAESIFELKMGGRGICPHCCPFLISQSVYLHLLNFLLSSIHTKLCCWEPDQSLLPVTREAIRRGRQRGPVCDFKSISEA